MCIYVYMYDYSIYDCRNNVPIVKKKVTQKSLKNKGKFVHNSTTDR